MCLYVCRNTHHLKAVFSAISLRNQNSQVVAVMLQEIVGIFADGDWHSGEEMARILDVSQDIADEVIRFLAKYGLVEYRVLDEKQFRWFKHAPGLQQAVAIVKVVSSEPKQTCSTIVSKLQRAD